MDHNLSIFADRIFYYENVISDPEKLIDLIESTDSITSEKSLISSWHTWTASNDTYVFGKRKTTNLDYSGEPDASITSIYEILDSTLSAYGNHYAYKLGINLGIKMPISISKYFVGASMGPHTDSSPNPTTENVSAVLYLNDDYVGGELNFPEQGVKIKPSAGSLVVFPSTPPFFHESLPIVSGTKYMSPAFWHLFD